MKIGFSLSPGGLLFPYHIGVLTSLQERGYVSDSTPLVGSSAGAIAVASHAVGVNSEQALLGCIRISEQCTKLGGARGRLMPLLEMELEAMIPRDGHEIVNQRSGLTGLAYREIFPAQKNVLATKFASKEELIEAVCNSSMFPFFTSNLPFAMRKGKGGAAFAGRQQFSSQILQAKDDKDDNQILSEGKEDAVEVIMKEGAEMAGIAASINDKGLAVPERSKGLALPRLVVDGFFTVPRNRFGCPEFPGEAGVTRQVTISCFPHELVGLTASEQHDQICPLVEEGENMMSLATLLGRAATQASTAQGHISIYERGYRDGMRWADEEDERLQEVVISKLQLGPF